MAPPYLEIVLLNKSIVSMLIGLIYTSSPTYTFEAIGVNFYGNSRYESFN